MRTSFAILYLIRRENVYIASRAIRKGRSVSENTGRIRPNPEKKPTVKWAPGKPVVQETGECNVAALVGALRCTPYRKHINYDWAVENIFEPVRTPNGSRLPDVLNRAIEEGVIRSFAYVQKEASLPLLKQWMKTGPVIVGCDWWTSMYAYQQGRLTIGGEKLETGHTWFAHTLNYTQKFVGFRSSWVNTGVYMVPWDMLAFLLANEGELAQVYIK